MSKSEKFSLLLFYAYIVGDSDFSYRLLRYFPQASSWPNLACSWASHVIPARELKRKFEF